jgi:hypothetical protein
MDADSPWKEILERYFARFVEFFFPEIFSEVAWEKGHEFLDKELQQIAPAAETGRRTVDKLVKVWLKDGSEIWTVIHVEIQGKADAGFAKRMYMYNYRLFDKHDRKIVSLAVLTDNRKNWRPNCYGYEICGCKVELQFPMVKLLDYRDDWDYLENSGNPFAVVVMTHLKCLETRKDPDSRLKWKLLLVKRLYQRGYQKEDILELFRFIDWIMMLPEDIEQQFSDDIYRYEEDMKMPYVTSVERQGIKKGQLMGMEVGIQQGVQQGIQQGTLRTFQESVMYALEARFETVPKSIRNKIKKINDMAVLKLLLKNAITAGSVKEFNKIMDTAIV